MMHRVGRALQSPVVWLAGLVGFFTLIPPTDRGLRQFFLAAPGPEEPEPELGSSVKNEARRIEAIQIPALLASPSPVLFQADPTPVRRGGLLTLHFLEDQRVDRVVRVVFYRDSDGDGAFVPDRDEPIGLDDRGDDGWSLTVPVTADLASGSVTFFARGYNERRSVTAPATNKVPVGLVD